MKLDITLDDRPKRTSHTTYEIVDNQAVIIDLNAGAYISLNETGSFFWERLDGETSLADIANALAEAYDVSPTITQPDVLDLAKALLNDAFIEL